MPGSSIPTVRKVPNRSRIAVEVANRQRRRVDRKLIARAVRKTLAERGWRGGTISVAVVDAEQMRRLNLQYLQHDEPTDALSFATSRDPRRGHLEGELIVCADVAAEAAAGQAWTWGAELVLYVVHAALHLDGYNDRTAGQRRRMQAAERRVLAALGLNVVPGELPAPKSSRYKPRRGRR
jgi:probable rRNA maturation factor